MMTNLSYIDLIVLRDALKVHAVEGIQECHNNAAGVAVIKELAAKLDAMIDETRPIQTYTFELWYETARGGFLAGEERTIKKVEIPKVNGFLALREVARDIARNFRLPTVVLASTDDDAMKIYNGQRVYSWLDS